MGLVPGQKGEASQGRGYLPTDRDFNILMTGMVLSIAHQAEFTPHSLRLLLRWELPRGHKSSGVSEVR